MCNWQLATRKQLATGVLVNHTNTEIDELLLFLWRESSKQISWLAMSDYLFEYSGTNMSLKNADDLWTLKELAQDRKEWTNSVTFIFPQKQQRTQWQTIKLHLWYLIRKFLTISDYLKFDINIIFSSSPSLYTSSFVFYKTEWLSNLPRFRMKCIFFSKNKCAIQTKM